MSSNADNSSSSPSSSYHRSDPIDIPLIDNHILSHLILPRIINSIKLAFPKVYLDWTTGTTTTSQNYDNAEEESSQDLSSNSLIKDSLFWKRIVENTLRLCLLLGSCRHIYNRSSNSDVQIKTPAMNSLGMFLQPSKSNSTSSPSSNYSSRYQQYTKIFALTVTTIIIPMIYKELKIYRMKQLEEREHQLRFNEIRSELLGSRNFIQQQLQYRSTVSQLSTLQNIIKQRAKQRQEYLISYITDCILGMSDIFIPSIRLVNYLSYLWGLSSCTTPQLGMRLVGWEYASSSVTVGESVSEGGDIGGQQHRHANFQYANRRLLVEEALRTVSMVVPPRRSIIDNNDATTGTEDQQLNASQLGNDRMNGNEVRRRETRRGGWMRKRFLSFMGVTDDNNNTATPSSTIDTTTVDSNKRRYTLTCSMCHVDNPSIPYIASCGHCYCYICLRMAVTDDLSFRCLDCGQMIVSSSRVK